MIWPPSTATVPPPPPPPAMNPQAYPVKGIKLPADSDKHALESEPAKKEGTKIVVPIYPTFSQSKGLVFLLVVFLLFIGLPAGWFEIKQDVAKVSQSPDGAFYIMEVMEKPGFIRSWFRDGGVYVYVRRVDGDGEDIKWYTYPDSRSLWFGSDYEGMFTGWAVEQAVKKYSVPVQIRDKNR